MFRPASRAGLLALLFALLAVPTLRGDNWPQWRGPLGTGISTEKSVPLEWSAQRGQEKNIAWSIKLPGPGNSTPVVWKDRVLVTCASPDGRERGTYCFDRKTGEELWKQVVTFEGEEPTHDTNPACSASPATDGEVVVVWHGSAGARAYDLEGKELWKRDLGRFEHIWGNAASPVIYKDLVILNLGPGLNAAVVALDRKSGDEAWRKEFPGMKSEKVDEYRGSWSTPVIYNDGQRDVALLNLPEALRAIDPTTGDEIWSCRGPSKLFYTSPIVSGDTIIAMCGFHGPAMAVRGGGQGDVTETHRLWLHTERNPQRVGSGVAVDGKVYILNDDGVAWCIDAATGEVHWKERLGRGAWGSAIVAAGRIYVTDQSGTTYVVEPNASELKVLAKNPLDGKTVRASPAVSEGQIFLRSYERLYCIQ